MKPNYPIYIPTKGRHKKCLTADYLIKDNIPFKLVIESQEVDLYADKYGKENILILPFSNLGKGVIPARNWIWEHSLKNGYERHWELDDNMRGFFRWYKGKRIYCDAGIALKVCEDFTDRYANIAIAGLNYTMFAVPKRPPFSLNTRVYSCLLILNKIPYRWRGKYNEDVDLCLQVLSGGWCTVLLNSFLVNKMQTMTIKGGNTKELYKGDGRLVMANSMKKMWPKVAKIYRRFQRPQHLVNWSKFDTPLILKKGVKIPNTPNEYGLKLKQKNPIKSKRLKKLVKEYNV